jgi:hypothetical protein
LQQDLVVPRLREETEDSFDGLICVVGVEGRHAEMPRLGERDSRFHGFRISDFTHQNHIGRLPQRILQRCRIRVSIGSDFALADHTALVRVHELDRVLDGNDMPALVRVAMVDHRRQGRGFAAAGSTNHQQQTALAQGDPLQDFGMAQIVERANLRADVPHHDCRLTALAKHVDTKAPDCAKRQHQIHLQRSAKFLALRWRHESFR